MQAGLGQFGNVKDIAVNGAATAALVKGADVSIKAQLIPAIQAFPHFGTALAEAPAHIGALVAKGSLGVALPVLGEAYLALQAADAVVGTGMLFVRMRLSHAKKVVAHYIVNEVIEANRRERVDEFYTGLVAKLTELNPAAGALLSQAWNKDTLELVHEKEAVSGVNRSIDKLQRKVRSEGPDGTESTFESDGAARDFARDAETFFTDVTPDTKSPPKQIAEMLTKTNYIQAKRVRFWAPRETTYNVLAVMVIQDIKQMLESNKSTLTGELLTDAEKTLLKSTMDTIRQNAIELNTGFKGIKAPGFVKSKHGWLFGRTIGIRTYQKDAMWSRPVRLFSQVKPAAAMIQEQIVGLAGLLGTDQIETLTQLTQNLQVSGFVGRLKEKRSKTIRQQGANLMFDFRDSILQPLQVSNVTDVARVNHVESIEARLLKYSRPFTNGKGEFEFTDGADNRSTRVKLVLEMRNELNKIIQEEYDNNVGGETKGNKGVPQISWGDVAKLSVYVFDKRRKIQDPGFDRRIAQDFGLLTVGSIQALWNWAHGEEKTVLANILKQVRNFGVELLPFDKVVKWWFYNVPIEKFIPGE